MQTLNSIVFGWYPYLCLTVFLFGSLFRFDREQPQARDPPDGYCRCCSFPIQPIRDRISTRKFDVGVFTQSGPICDIAPFRQSQP
jgi:nitrate reductase gamma subunit